MLTQPVKPALDFLHLCLELLEASHVGEMLVSGGVLLDEARFLELRQVLVQNSPLLAHFIVHPLKVFWLEASRAQTCQGAALGAVVSESFSQQSFDRLGLHLNPLSDIIDVCVNSLLDTDMDLLVQTSRCGVNPPGLRFGTQSRVPLLRVMWGRLLDSLALGDDWILYCALTDESLVVNRSRVICFVRLSW